MPWLLLACATTQDSDTAPDTTVPTSGVFSDCDPLAPDYCGAPFPSSFYLREDSFSATGWRVQLGATTLPYTDQDEIAYQPEPTLWNELDGFSPLTPLVTLFPGQGDSGFVTHDNIEDSVADDASIVIFDWDSGERVPYFAELDYAGTDDQDAGDKMFFVRPVTPLQHGHRYVVAMRGLVDAAGAPLPASEAFAALRDGDPSSSWDVEGRRALYEEIFPKIEAQGWTRAETLLAWDFVVKSADQVAEKVLWMREDAQERLGADGPAYVIDSIEDEVDEHWYRRIQGRMTVPLYTESDDAPTLLTRDADGMPYYNNQDVERDFTIMIPRSLATDPRPAPMIQYGHGLLGSQGEVDAGYLGEIADRHGYVLFAVNWTGMAEDDYNPIIELVLQDLSGFGKIAEREQQGFVEFLAAAWMMKGAMASDAAVSFDGVSVIDTEKLYYYGNSQGAILGGAYIAVAPEFDRACLGVGGMPYSLLLSRSADFDAYFALFRSVYDDEVDIAFWMALMQQLWDPGEAGGFGRLVNETPLDGTPAKTVLLQVARGDAQVTNLGAHIQARAYGAALLDEPVREIYGLETVASPTTGSVLVEYDFDVPEEPSQNIPPDSETDTHEDTRRAWAAQEQMIHFFESGEILNYCDGACFCATGACDEPAAD